MHVEVRTIGRVESALRDLESAPRQADEGAPEAWLIFDADVLEGVADIHAGDEIIVITWLDRARRDVLSAQPRGTRAPQGVFSTRSPHRPNPIGLHRTEVIGVEPGRVRVRHMEALHATPIIDVKPVLDDDVTRR